MAMLACQLLQIGSLAIWRYILAKKWLLLYPYHNNWSCFNLPPKNLKIKCPDYGVTPFAANLQTSSEQIAEEINTFNAINKQLTNQYKVQYLDITAISRLAKNDNALLANDGLHPSGKMYGLWAEKLAEQISSSLGKNKTKQYST